MIRRLRYCLALACVVAATTTFATAAPRVTPAATRAELASWIAELRTDGRPREWQYWFVAGDERRVEALSLLLVEAGYAIVRLGRSSADGDVELIVARLELHTPTSLMRRQADLSVMARRNGVLYLGVDAT